MPEDLEKLSGIGENLAAKLQTNEDIRTIEELAIADPHVLTNIKGIRVKRAENLVTKAEEYLNDIYDDRQWDTVEQKYYDAGPSAYECECGYRIDDKDAFQSHQRRCPQAGDSACIDCGDDADYKVVDENNDEYGVCDTHIFDHIPMDDFDLSEEEAMADG